MTDSLLVDLWGFRRRRRRIFRTIPSLVVSVVLIVSFLAALRRNSISRTPHEDPDWIAVDRLSEEQHACENSAAEGVCETRSRPLPPGALPNKRPTEWFSPPLVPSNTQSDDSSSIKSEADALSVSHIYRTDGLLEANPASTQHPISQLVNDGKKKWAEKLGGQSKSLSQAIQEYQRRYKRLPPRGFDIW